MGSDSDLKVMSKAAVMLEELGIEYEMTIISAHREPDELIEWTRGAEDRGICLLYTSYILFVICAAIRRRHAGKKTKNRR